MFTSIAAAISSAVSAIFDVSFIVMTAIDPYALYVVIPLFLIMAIVYSIFFYMIFRETRLEEAAIAKLMETKWY